MEASSEYTATTNGSSQSPWEAHEAAESVGRPELPVIGAFVAGFVFAKLLARFGGGDD
ncbi:MAG TPA: hypothetical protein VH247_10000 [Thermoleophilaceae bacterium]|jgi:hypothetical protein|nr:hypothetical protein [Thermoleophilaceae bacterium]